MFTRGLSALGSRRRRRAPRRYSARRRRIRPGRSRPSRRNWWPQTFDRMRRALLVTALVCAASSCLLEKQPEGGPCTLHEDCEGRWCVTDTCSHDWRACTAGSCPAGMTCYRMAWGRQPECWRLPRQAGEQCDPSTCTQGLACLHPLGEASKCVDPEAYRGRPCSGPEACGPLLACRFDMTPAVCGNAGETGADCLRSPCADGLRCNQAMNPPQCRPPAREGDACVRGPSEPSLAPSDCGDGLACNWAASDRPGRGLCAPPGDRGTPCLRANECQPGLSCQPGGTRGSTCQ